MKVYVLQDYEYRLIGVFSSRELAQDHRKTLNKMAKGYVPYPVTKIDLDHPIPQYFYPKKGKAPVIK